MTPTDSHIIVQGAGILAGKDLPQMKCGLRDFFVRVAAPDEATCTECRARQSAESSYRSDGELLASLG